MPKLVGIFLSRRYQDTVTASIGVFAFLVFVAISALIASERLQAMARSEATEVLADFGASNLAIIHALDLLDRQAAGLVCGDAMQIEMRRVSFLPDGLNEFFYMPDRVALCSTNAIAFDEPHVFGTPDVGMNRQVPFEMWFAEDMAFAGHRQGKDAIVRRGDFAVLLNPPETRGALPDWMKLEGVLVADSGSVRPFNGTPGVFAAAKDTSASSLLVARQTICDAEAFQCVGLSADLVGGLFADRVQLAGGLGLCAILAAITAAWGRRRLVRHFSFDARFVRHFDQHSLICVYQPIIEVESGRMIGCEVLARWRDIDDSIIMPDHFIPVVEREGMTMAFTRLVIRKAEAELSRHIPAGSSIQVNVNVFPADMGESALPESFAPLTAEPGRYAPVAEIVETESLHVPTAQRQIEALRRHGIRTYIDDFGSGYSNIQTLAALAVDGVKLDRCFAMAQEGSVMARMLNHAVEMVHTAGRAIVVEGVESAHRLDELRALPAHVDYAQGYHISRPLPIEAFAALLAASRAKTPLKRAA